MMPTPNRFLLKYSGNTFECEPDNWAEVEMGFTRQGYGLDRQITSEFTFSRQAATILKGLFEASGFNAVCTLEFAKRQNDWTYTVFNTFAADFSTYSYDRGKVKLSFIENSVRKLLSDNKGTDYQFNLPTTNNLLYTGVSFEKANKMLATEGSMTEWPYNASCFPIRSKRVIRTSTTLFDFATNDMAAKAKISGLFDVEVYIGIMVMQLIGLETFIPAEGSLRLIKTDITGHWKETLHEFKRITPAKGYERFEDYGVFNLSNVSISAGEYIVLWYDTGNHAINAVSLSGQHHDGYLKLTNTDISIYQAHEVPVVSHDWLLEKLLRKIVPAFVDEVTYPLSAILDYNLPLITADVDYVPVLTSGSGLIQDSGATITVSIEKVLKSLKCLYGADYDITGNKMRVDYASTFFSAIQATDTLSNVIDIVPINKPVISVDMEHVYNKITVGWETDENATNGQLEINCKNVFTIPNAKVEKELDLVHPFKGSMYTIEQYMLDKDSDTNTTKDSDTSVFIFAVNPIIGTDYEGYKSGTLDNFYSDVAETVLMTPVTGKSYYDLKTKQSYVRTGSAYVIGYGFHKTTLYRPTSYIEGYKGQDIDTQISIVSGFKDSDNTHFYNDSGHTSLITPVVGVYYKDLPQTLYYKWGGDSYMLSDLPYVTAFFSVSGPKIIPVTGSFYLDLNYKKYYSWNGTAYVNEPHGPENIPPMAYNIPYSPMRLMLANISYIAVSCYLQAVKTIQFASTDRKADYYSKIGATVINEDSIPSSSIPAPLFLPISVEFDTALKLWTLADINNNLYKYFELINKNTAETYKIWIKDITLQMTRINSQTWKGIAYDL